MPQSDQHEQLLEERGAQYGDAYAQTDRWIREHLTELGAAPSPLGLIMMHFKLTRALHTPKHRDHYDDLIGYAKLALRSLEAQQVVNSWLTDTEFKRVSGD